jgi:hypothetical protein
VKCEARVQTRVIQFLGLLCSAEDAQKTDEAS